MSAFLDAVWVGMGYAGAAMCSVVFIAVVLRHLLTVTRPFAKVLGAADKQKEKAK